MKWGLPQLQVRMDYENDGKLHKIYENYEDAVEFVKMMKHLN